MTCFSPILVFAILYVGKILCFKMKHTPLHVVVALSILASLFAFSSHFDLNTAKQTPLYLTVVPSYLILVSLALHNSLDIVSERDECVRLFNGYTSTLKCLCTHLELVFTLLYSVISCFLLFFMYQSFTSATRDVWIIDQNLLAVLVYLLLTIRQNGQAFMDLILFQFRDEMIN
jgi:hypothetical protein